jgi:membrane fusion protein, heavy metal efflux system
MARGHASIGRGAAVAAAIVALGCSSRTPGAEVRAVVPQPDGSMLIPDGSPLRTGLVFDTARTALRSDIVVATASVESDPARTVAVRPPLAGRIVTVDVALGDAVVRGQQLLTLASPDFTSAQADYSHALVAYRQAKNALARQQDLARYGIAAQRDVEQAETDFSQADGDVQRAAAHLALLGIDTTRALTDRALIIRSPIAGRVTDLSAGAGEFHNDPTVPVMTVADLATVFLAANVPEKDLAAVRLGEHAAAVLSAYPTDTVHGTVAMVGAVVDTATRMTTVRVRLPNPVGRFKPGMYATIAFAAHPAPVVIVPATALLRTGDSTYVFVETRPWTLERRSVLIGAIDDGRAVVRSGLAGGERIVGREVVLLQ